MTRNQHPMCYERGKPSGLRELRNRTYQRLTSKMSSGGMMFELSSRSEEVCSRQRE